MTKVTRAVAFLHKWGGLIAYSDSTCILASMIFDNVDIYDINAPHDLVQD